MTSAETSRMDDVAPLGQRIREARLDARLSVRGLAERVNVSPSFISQVELGRATPSVGTLFAIATHLGLSLDALMRVGSSAVRSPSSSLAAPSWKPQQIGPADGVDLLPGLQGFDQRPEITLNGVTWERLTSKDDQLVEFLRVIYPSGSESCSPDSLQRHEGWEYGHVLSGQLDVEVGFSRGTLGEGDSINFSSTTPHRLSNPREEKCVAIWVVIGRSGRGAVDTHIATLMVD